MQKILKPIAGFRIFLFILFFQTASCVNQAVGKPLCQFKFPFHTFLFVEQADAQSRTIIRFPAVWGSKIKKDLRQAGVVVFIGKPGLQSFGSNRLGNADRHHAATVGQIQRKQQRKGEINFAVPILQGRLPAAHGKKGIRAKQGKYIFMFAFNFAPRKRLMKIRPKIVFAVIEQNQRIGRCLQQIRLFHGSIFHVQSKFTSL